MAANTRSRIFKAAASPANARYQDQQAKGSREPGKQASGWEQSCFLEPPGNGGLNLKTPLLQGKPTAGVSEYL